MNRLDRIALAAIAAYQRHLSPQKGFCCAHRIQYGGPSCSEYACQTLTVYGLWQTLPLIRDRLRACRDAARAFTARREDDEARKKRRRDAVLDCLPDACPDSCDSGDCLPDSCSRLGARR